MRRPETLTMPFVLGVGALTAMAGAQASFDDPVEITAGDKTFEATYYPTPVLVDIDGDAQRELVVGDLTGRIVACERVSDDPAQGWAEATPLKAEGKPLKLNNW